MSDLAITLLAFLAAFAIAWIVVPGPSRHR